MRIDFESWGKASTDGMSWAKAKVIDLTTDEVIENVVWIDFNEGTICYYVTDDKGKFVIVGEGTPDWCPKRVIRHGRFRLEMTTKPAHPNIKGREWELRYIECTVEMDRPHQRVVHPEPLPPNTQKVIHQVDLEDGKSASERNSSEA